MNVLHCLENLYAVILSSASRVNTRRDFAAILKSKVRSRGHVSTNRISESKICVHKFACTNVAHTRKKENPLGQNMTTTLKICIRSSSKTFSRWLKTYRENFNNKKRETNTAILVPRAPYIYFFVIRTAKNLKFLKGLVICIREAIKFTFMFLHLCFGYFHDKQRKCFSKNYNICWKLSCLFTSVTKEARNSIDHTHKLNWHVRW